MGERLIEATGLTKEFHLGEQIVAAVDGVDMAIDAREIVSTAPRVGELWVRPGRWH